MIIESCSSDAQMTYAAAATVMPLPLCPVRCRGISVFLSSSSTAHLLAPLENISRSTHFHCHSRAWNSSLLTLETFLPLMMLPNYLVYITLHNVLSPSIIGLCGC